VNQIISTDAPADITWPSDYTRVPYQAYVDQDLFNLEQEKLFLGPCWHLIGLECEIVEPGDFVATYIGNTPIVYSRGPSGDLHAFVNRCAHRGARVIRELRGNNPFPTCPYHNWRYDITGNLKGVSMEKGLRGKGGYGEDFSKECNGLRKLRIESHAGVLFATFSDETPPLREYLGEDIWERIAMIGSKPLRVVGYQRQSIKCNWKLFVENNRDTYHGPQLHSFVPNFGLVNPAERAYVDIKPPHALLTSRLPTNEEGAAEIPAPKGRFKLEDTGLAQNVNELEDIQVSVVSIFPSSLFTCIRNVRSCRRLIPRDPETLDIEYIWFGYEDDDEEMKEMRRKQNNILGPAGYVAMEDAEVLEMVQNAISRDGAEGLLEFGGNGTESTDHFNTEASIRGFWKGYCELMDIAPAAAVQENVQ
jgi:phenylpropionate dioxygenase-like ring-hydroxylating dioxygenase large terminal subunit